MTGFIKLCVLGLVIVMGFLLVACEREKGPNKMWSGKQEQFHGLTIFLPPDYREQPSITHTTFQCSVSGHTMVVEANDDGGFDIKRGTKQMTSVRPGQGITFTKEGNVVVAGQD